MRSGRSRRWIGGWVVPEAMCRRFRELDSCNVDSRDNTFRAQTNIYCSTTRHACSMTLIKSYEHDTSAKTPVVVEMCSCCDALRCTAGRACGKSDEDASSEDQGWRFAARLVIPPPLSQLAAPARLTTPHPHVNIHHLGAYIASGNHQTLISVLT